MSQRDTWKVGILGTAGYVALSMVLSVVVPGDQSQVASATRQSENASQLLAQRGRSRKEVPEKQIDKVEASLAEDEAVEIATEVVTVAAQDTAEVAETTAGEKYHDDNWWLPKSGRRTISGLTTCTNSYCHGSSGPNSIKPEEQKLTGNPIVDAARKESGGWILGNEFMTWATRDKHAQAFIVLQNDRSKEMAKIMGVLDANGDSAIHRDKRCLACHASFPLEILNKNTEENNPHLISTDYAQRAGLNFKTGVNCEGCHGPAGAVDGGTSWFAPHQNKTWRHTDPKTKFEDYGYWDVRNLVTRTKICVSCHVGNAGQGKVVTHEMYAAGHPPLPGFEIATFIHQEPQHWRDFGAKAVKAQEEFLKETGSNYNVKAANKTTAAMVASLVTLGDSLRLSADLIDDQSAFPDAGIPKPSWPELANFACFNCHHDLRASSWRQDRTTGLTPGRPNIHEWPLANVAIAVKMAGKDKEFWEAYGNVQKSLDSNPFGGEEFKNNARAVADWLDNLGHEWAKTPIKREDMPAILMTICDVALDEHMDYDSTRQLIWMFSSVYREWKSPVKVGDLPVSFESWYSGEDLDEIETVLKKMSDHILLDLRAGRKKGEQELDNLKVPTVEVDATVILPKIADFDPQAAIRDSFAQLKQLLSKGK